MGVFRGAGDIVGKCILDLLKTFNLRWRMSVVKSVAIIKTSVTKGSGDSSGGGKVKRETDTMEVTNVVMAGASK